MSDQDLESYIPAEFNGFHAHLFDKVPVMLQLLDVDGRIVDVNEHWLTTLGYSKEEVIGRYPNAFLHPSSQRIVELEVKQRLKLEGSVKDIHLTALSKSGKPVEISYSAHAEKDLRGQISHTYSVGVNITANIRLQRSLQLSDSILNNVNNVILVSNARGEIIYSSSYIHELLGYRREQVLGNGWWEHAHRGNYEERDKAVELAKRSLSISSYPYESIIYAADGSKRCLLFKDAYGPDGLVIGVGYDITERNTAREKLRLYNSRTEMMLDIEKAIVSSESLQQTFYGVLRKMMSFLIYCNRISFTLFDDHFEHARFYFAHDASPDELDTGKVIPLEDFSSFELIKDGRYTIIENLNEKKTLSSSDLEILRKGVNSYLIMPVMYKGEILGSINLGSRFVNPFVHHDIELIQDVANEIGIAISHHRLQEKLEEKNNEISAKNKDITSSIQYAKRIQDAIFPHHEFNQMSQHNESFVLFKPKDIVSGDFYWVNVDAERNVVHFAVVDCTGHGVPGAMMSIVGFNSLNQAVKEKKLDAPDEILSYLNLQHYITFNQGKTDRILQDGMDIALCRLDKNTGVLEFAGANLNMVLVNRGRIQLFKGKRLSIGGHHQPEKHYFDNYRITVNEGDMVYLSSDGYTDQFGGPEGRKFLHHNFHDLLLEIHKNPVQEQLEILDQTMNQWQGQQHDQVDDICVIGVRI